MVNDPPHPDPSADQDRPVLEVSVRGDEVSVIRQEDDLVPPTAAGPPGDGGPGDGAGGSPVGSGAPADGAEGVGAHSGWSPFGDRRPPGWPVVRLWALVALVVLALVVSVAMVFAAQAPTIDELRRRAGWEDVQTLQVGVSGDVPGISECLPGKPCTGFDVEIAKLVADWLGVPRSNVEFYEVLTENRNRMLGTRQGTTTTIDLDLVVAGFSITEDRMTKDHVVFAGPYLTTETTVLTRRDHEPVASLVALDALVPDGGGGTRPQRVCTAGTSTSAGYLQAEVRRAQVVPLQRNSECVRRLRAGQVDAAVTDAAILAGFQARYPTELRLNNIASAVDENWGIGVGRDVTGRDERIQARRQLVLLALEDLRTAPGQEAWRTAFEQLPPAVVEPNQEVQVVASNLQPTPVGLERVRRWPWERTGTGTGR